MAQISKCLRSATNRYGSKMLLFWCPGCDQAHGVYVEKGNNEQQIVWDFNGNMEKPTFSPSILLSGHDKHICHSFVTDGRIQFLQDCTHHLAGFTADLPSWPYPPGTYGGIDD